MPESLSYLFLELALLATLIVFSVDAIRFRELISGRFLWRASVLFVVWLLVDQIAVGLGIWYFPPKGTLSVRLFDLPLEEYICFVLHTVICYLALRRIGWTPQEGAL